MQCWFKVSSDSSLWDRHVVSEHRCASSGLLASSVVASRDTSRNRSSPRDAGRSPPAHVAVRGASAWTQQAIPAAPSHGPLPALPAAHPTRTRADRAAGPAPVCDQDSRAGPGAPSHCVARQQTAGSALMRSRGPVRSMTQWTRSVRGTGRAGAAALSAANFDARD